MNDVTSHARPSAAYRQRNISAMLLTAALVCCLVLVRPDRAGADDNYLTGSKDPNYDTTKQCANLAFTGYDSYSLPNGGNALAVGYSDGNILGLVGNWTTGIGFVHSGGGVTLLPGTKLWWNGAVFVNEPINDNADIAPQSDAVVGHMEMWSDRCK